MLDKRATFVHKSSQGWTRPLRAASHGEPGMVSQQEQEALQALLRGASEADALMPPTSQYARSVQVLRAGILRLLREVPESQAAEHPSGH